MPTRFIKCQQDSFPRRQQTNWRTQRTVIEIKQNYQVYTMAEVGWNVRGMWNKNYDTIWNYLFPKCDIYLKGASIYLFKKCLQLLFKKIRYWEKYWISSLQSWATESIIWLLNTVKSRVISKLHKWFRQLPTIP